MPGECHAHVIMDGKNYRQAVDLHKEGVQDYVIHRCFAAYKDLGITFVRDGGDSLGVSKRAKELAPKYDIDYISPIFAIHKKGHYGGIVGRSFEDMKEYHKRVLEAKEEGADFIKIMTSGIMDFENKGAVSGKPLEAEEVKEMIHIAHQEGMSVMSHTNSAYAAFAAISAGVDSLEHGNFMDDECLHLLSEANTVWVPTLATIWNLLGCGRYNDDSIRYIMDCAKTNVQKAWEYKANVALGSDAGAYMVDHGQGILDEYQIFKTILGNPTGMDDWLRRGEKQIKERFRRK